MDNMPWYFWLIAALIFLGGWYFSRKADGAGRRREEGEGAAPPPPPASGPSAGAELVAVISAAVAVASGLAPGQFRITHIEGSGRGPGPYTTPPWGHVDRFNRPEYHR